MYVVATSFTLLTIVTEYFLGIVLSFNPRHGFGLCSVMPVMSDPLSNPECKNPLGECVVSWFIRLSPSGRIL